MYTVINRLQILDDGDYILDDNVQRFGRWLPDSRHERPSSGCQRLTARRWCLTFSMLASSSPTQASICSTPSSRFSTLMSSFWTPGSNLAMPASSISTQASSLLEASVQCLDDDIQRSRYLYPTFRRPYPGAQTNALAVPRLGERHNLATPQKVCDGP